MLSHAHTNNPLRNTKDVCLCVCVHFHSMISAFSAASSALTRLTKNKCRPFLVAICMYMCVRALMGFVLVKQVRLEFISALNAQMRRLRAS